MVEIEHYSNGNIRKIAVKNENGHFHNEHGPAIQEWFENGQEWHRAHWINGKRHNKYGPAVQIWYKNGQEECREYFINDEFHNEIVPAYQSWRLNGQERCKEYWINGKQLTEEEFQDKVKANWDATSYFYKLSDELFREFCSKKECEEFWNIENLHELKDTFEVYVDGKPVRISKQSAEKLGFI